MGVGNFVSSGRLPRDQSWYGLAIRGRPGNAEAQCSRRLAVADSDCSGTRAVDWARGGRCPDARSGLASELREDRRRSRLIWSRGLQALAQRASALGRHGSWIPGFDDLVFLNGDRSRCRTDAVAGLAGDVGDEIRASRHAHAYVDDV